MSFCFYSLLMRRERGVSGCAHWCGRTAVHGLRVISCARALSHLPTTRTRHVITESWPWRSGPQREVLYSWSFKSSHPTQIRHAQLVPHSPLLYTPAYPPIPSSRRPWAPGPVLPRVTWPLRSGVLVGGEVQTAGPSDRTIWTSDLT